MNDVDINRALSLAIETPVIPGISQTESRVAVAIALGLRRPVVADAFGISPKTYDCHRTHVLKKLGVDNDVMLARLAIKNGWVPAP